MTKKIKNKEKKSNDLKEKWEWTMQMFGRVSIKENNMWVEKPWASYMFLGTSVDGGKWDIKWENARGWAQGFGWGARFCRFS